MSSTSAAKKSQPRPCKYKDSCDACARSKVKCDRVRPCCQRCVRTGIVCRYSPARRGKAASLSLSSPNNTGEPAPQFSAEVGDFFADGRLNFADRNFSPQSDFATSHFPDFNIACNDVGMHMSSTGGTRGCSPDRVEQAAPDSSPEFGGPLDPLRAGTTQSGLLDWGDIHLDRMTNNNLPLSSQPALLDPLLSPASSMTTTTTTSQIFDNLIKHDHGSSAEGMCSGHSECIRLAISTFQSLHTPSSTCVLQPISTSNRTQGMDVILETNKMAIESVLTVLRCPCSADEPNAILLALICSQIIDSYQRISLVRQNLAATGETDTDQLGGDGSETDSHMSSSPGTAMTMDTDLDVPIAIGGYMLHGSAKRRMISSVLLSDLAKVGEAVDKVNCPSRRGSTKGGGGGGGNGDSEVVSTFKSVLRAKLRAMVRALRSELAQF